MNSISDKISYTFDSDADAVCSDQRDTLMCREDFEEYVTKTLEEHYGDTRIICRGVVTRNNAVALNGLTIRRKDRNIAPTFYFDNIYDNYARGASIDSILADIYTKEDSEWAESVDSLSEFSFEWEQIRNRITYRVVNFDKNAEFLMDAPYESLLDLAVIYQCVVQTGDNDFGSIRISNRHLDILGISEEELKEAAKANTDRADVSFRPILDVISHMIDGCSDIPMEKENMEMFVLSNKRGIFGATLLFDDGCLRKIYEKLEGDYYVLPSSVHEVIIIPTRAFGDVELLKQMVREVNTTQVASDEVLSDSVYVYDEYGLRLA